MIVRLLLCPICFPPLAVMKAGQRGHDRTKRGPPSKHILFGVFFSLAQPFPHITANTFPCSFPCLHPSLAATPTCLHIHFIKLQLSNALCSVEADRLLLFNWPTASPLLLNKWEGQWLLMTWDDDVCQYGPKDRFILEPHQEYAACSHNCLI